MRREEVRAQRADLEIGGGRGGEWKRSIIPLSKIEGSQA